MKPNLRIDTSHKIPNLPKTTTPSPNKTTYSDRFIPCRSSSRFQTFGLTDGCSPGKEGGGNDAYARLLRAELFGDEFFGCSPVKGSPSCSPSPGKNMNMFRYKTEHSSPSSPLVGLGVLGGDGSGVGGEVSTPPKVPKKVAKTPSKVLDAPSLQDDFYLNLVDWSSQNVLAVRLGTCVYLWTATNSKVTKLCDLGPTDSVCAVQWTREGSYLAIGTTLGDVQIWDGSRCKRIRTMGGHQTRTGV